MKRANKASVITLVGLSPEKLNSNASRRARAQQGSEQSSDRIRAQRHGSVERVLKQADNRNAQSTARQAVVGEAPEFGRVIDRDPDDGRSRSAEVRPLEISDEPLS